MSAKCPRCSYDNPDDSDFCGKCTAPIRSSEGDRRSRTLIGGWAPDVPGREGILAGKYRLLGELGRGGMGIVYKAEDIRLERAVALKFLPAETAEDPEARERFFREARAAAALSHDHICAVYEIGEEERRLFIAMEFIEGRSLRERIARGPLAQAEALEIAVQVAEGLAEAHKKRIIHRDIKPANIMLTEKGSAKVMDFGLAKALGRTLITREARAMGTAAYMSPEQARSRPLDGRTDIWSLGVVLYEMLSGRLPFPGEHEQSIIHALLTREPEPLSRIRPELPQSLERIVAKALSKNPSGRYQTMEDFRDDLQAAAGGLKPRLAKTGPFRGRVLGVEKKYVWAGLGALLALSVLALVLLRPSGGPGRDSIAVLPLENLSGDPGQEFFSDGIHEALITDLGRLSGLKRVIARGSVMRFKGSKTSLAAIGRELHVGVLLTGAVLRAGGRVRITAQLINAATEAQMWAHSYERDLGDVLSLQNELVSAITREVNVKLSPQEETRLSGTPRVHPEAYEACLKGQFHWYKLTKADLERALQYFEAALDKDPAYAQAYAGIAGVWVGRQQQGFVPTSEAAPRAKAAAAKALALDNSLAEVHFMLGGILTWTDWDWKGGEAAFRRAIELNPGYPDPRASLSHLLNIVGRPREALAQIEKAMELDPLNALFRGFYAMDLMYARRYDEAISLLRETLRTSPNDLLSLSALRSAYHLTHRDAEALEVWKASFAARGDREAEEALARGAKENGYRGGLQRVAEAMAERSRTMYIPAWQIGTLYTRAGLKQQALDWLEKALAARDPNTPYLAVDPIFDPLRSDPRFRQLLARLNLPVGGKE